MVTRSGMRIIAYGIAAVLCSVLVLKASYAGATPLGTAFTYQGQLKQNGGLVNATADFEFTLWPSAFAGVQLGPIQAVSNVALVDGLFTVQIDFGNNVFDGSERWLQVAVRSPAGSGIFTTLSPRQELTPVPYALQTRGLFVSAGGSLGVGTDAPLSRVTVNGDLTFVEDTDSIRFPAVVGATAPMIEMFASGTVNNDRMVIAHSPTFANWGLEYQDDLDRFRFVGGGESVMAIDLAAGGDIIFDSDLTSLNFPAADASNAPIVHLFPGAGNANRMVLAHSPAFPNWGLQYNDTLDRFVFLGAGSPAMSVELGSGDVDVAGDLIVGPTNLDATAGEERLRIIRGTINTNGTVAAGAGFTCVQNGGGDYTITFSAPFAGTPSVVVTPTDNDTVALQAQVYSVGATWVTVLTKREASDVPLPSNVSFSFIAAGPR